MSSRNRIMGMTLTTLACSVVPTEGRAQRVRPADQAPAVANEQTQPRIQTVGLVSFSLASPSLLPDLASAETFQTIVATGTAQKTDVWVALIDATSLPGAESMVSIKGPATCGAFGCETTITGNVGGSPATLLTTLAETVHIAAKDTVIVNRGSRFEVVWTFNGSTFVESK